jgi:hypothetical protein
VVNSIEIKPQVEIFPQGQQESVEVEAGLIRSCSE